MLHINGGQGYEDVKHNFEFWLPKLSGQAVVLFHDINVRESETGVWKFFHELSQQFLGRTFSFIHSHGLGLLIVGDNVPDMLQHLCSLKDNDVTYVRLAFSTFGRLVNAQATESTLRSKLEELDSTNRQMITNRRKMEIESYKYEIQLAAASLERERQAHSALQERDRQIEELQGMNQLLIQSLSMRLTKPLRDLNSLVRRLR